MSKVAEQNDKLKRATIISVVLHIFLITLLIWSSFDQHIDASSGGDGDDIDAVMVDPGAVVGQYNRQQDQQSDSKRAGQQRQKQAQQQAEELQQKQTAEQQHLKEMEKERLQAQDAAKQAQEQQKQLEAAAAKVKADAKAQADAQAKAAADAQEKAEAEAKKAAADAKKQAEAKQVAAEAAKVKAAQEAKARAVQEAKEAKEQAAAVAKAKAAAEAAKDSSDVNDLLGGLSSGKNAPKEGKTGGAAAGQGNQKKSGASGTAINSYLGQVQGAIQSKFYDADTFKGRTCDVHIKLAPDGLLISATAAGGDAALCQAAINAAHMARIPKPPGADVYQAVKDATLEFKPQ